jgi:hypothetical protein
MPQPLARLALCANRVAVDAPCAVPLGEELNARWRAELDGVYSALDAFAPRGDVLELAYGTGEWTIRLAESATRLVKNNVELRGAACTTRFAPEAASRPARARSS